MKVLLVNDYGTPSGGAELQSVRIRDLLRVRGHDAMLFTSDARPVPVAPASDLLCFGSRGGIGRITQVANPWAAAALRRAIASFRPDVIHLRMFLSQLSPLILPVLRDTPTILHVVNYQLICPLNTKLLLPEDLMLDSRYGWYVKAIMDDPETRNFNGAFAGHALTGHYASAGSRSWSRVATSSASARACAS